MKLCKTVNHGFKIFWRFTFDTHDQDYEKEETHVWVYGAKIKRLFWRFGFITEYTIESADE